MAAKLQGSGDAVRARVNDTNVSGWCRMHIDDERADEHFPTFRDVPAPDRTGKACPRRRRLSEDICAARGGPTGRRGLLWRQDDDGQDACARRSIGGSVALRL